MSRLGYEVGRLFDRAIRYFGVDDRWDSYCTARQRRDRLEWPEYRAVREEDRAFRLEMGR